MLKRKVDDCSFSTLNKMVKGQDPLKSIMTSTKLKSCLKTFGSYPANQRTLAWRSLLNLPMNEEAFRNLCSQGVHPAYKELRQQYPIENDSLFSRLQRTLSCLAHYYPFLAEVDYLPELVFPFVKLFQRGEELVLFEVRRPLSHPRPSCPSSASSASTTSPTTPRPRSSS